METALIALCGQPAAEPGWMTCNNPSCFDVSSTLRTIDHNNFLELFLLNHVCTTTEMQQIFAKIYFLFNTCMCKSLTS